jgi:multidrug efflux pump subunit AcrB
MPLALATGPGAGAQTAIGRAVVGGTLTATFLAIFFVPLFFVFVKRCFHLDKPAASPRLQPAE